METDNLDPSRKRIISKLVAGVDKRPTVRLEGPALNQDSIEEVEREHRMYSRMLQQDTRAVLLYQCMIQYGATDEFLKEIISHSDGEATFMINDFFDGLLKSGRILPNENNRIAASTNNLRNEPVLMLGGEDDIPEGVAVVDYLKEDLRVTQENLTLLDIYLAEKRKEARDRKKEAKKAEKQARLDTKKKQATEEVPIEPEEALVEIPIESPLEGWKLSYTTVDWSTNPNHLVAFDSLNGQTLTDQLGRIYIQEGVIQSASPALVVKRLEYYLRPDNAVRLKGLRHKYNHPEWVDIRASKARIACYIEEGSDNLIFFVGRRLDQAS